jgi:D-alanyl-lipoteichoic acid acyltransferase DltB (MBOAT superfamily)
MLSFFLIPALFIKIVINQLYILTHTKKEKYKGQTAMFFILSIFITPFIILTSVFVDIFSLAEFLMKDERNFQFKYKRTNEDYGVETQ